MKFGNNELLTRWESVFEEYFSNKTFEDNSHDINHFKRVWRTAQKISEPEVDELVVLAACYFHDIVNYPKNDERRSKSSIDAARKTEDILLKLDFPKEKIGEVKHCIEAHSFSANIKPETVEAKIVQDADRMEALGAIGLARTFYVAGKMNSELFDGLDPFAENRELNDKKFAVDHFQVKLLKLSGSMQTKKGRIEANTRNEVLLRFLKDLANEV